MAASSDNYAFADAMAAQHSFATKYNLEDPTEAATAYARYLVEHTRQQLKNIDPNAATNASHRRAFGSDAFPIARRTNSKTPNLTPESSTDGVSRSMDA